MPKDTFFNLPDEKKRKLVQALHKEFSQHPLINASIARIIATAEIPRGSFYQYFSDLSDAYFYMFDQQITEVADQLMKILREERGDIFQSSQYLFSWLLKEREHFSLLTQALLNLNGHIHQAITSVFTIDTEVIFHLQLEVAPAPFENKTYFSHLLRVISATMIHNFIEAHTQILPLEAAVYNFSQDLQLLNNGHHTVAL
ncbi:TetR/AcrR family transcriptional regulator [Gracilibacillus phocaeensis]|uniref:TetR/AcrR family transcriptional regulator n=1 Tax=Gracilibacillus phocaeensis TaxID=2042304 RepID=UPI00102F503C|nr:TetR/AcrR family transcriptional regulator [Gracilibacillus phocaeensis]